MKTLFHDFRISDLVEAYTYGGHQIHILKDTDRKSHALFIDKILRDHRTRVSSARQHAFKIIDGWMAH